MQATHCASVMLAPKTQAYVIIMLKTDEVELAVILVGKIVKPQIIWVSSVYICSQHAWKTMDPNDMQHNVYVEIL